MTNDNTGAPLHTEAPDPNHENLRPRFDPAGASYLDGLGATIGVDTDGPHPFGVLEVQEGQIRWTDIGETERITRVVDVAARNGIPRGDLYMLLLCTIRYHAGGEG